MFDDLLCDFELTTRDEIDSFDHCLTLCVHFLPAEESLRSHVLVNFLDDVCAQIREDAEASQELYNLLQLALLFLADDPDVIFAMESSKTALGRAQDRSCTAIVLEECKFAERLTRNELCYCFEPSQGDRGAACRIQDLVDGLVQLCVTLGDGSVKRLKDLLALEDFRIIENYLEPAQFSDEELLDAVSVLNLGPVDVVVEADNEAE